MATDMIDRLFPNLEDVLTVHQSYSLAMKQKTARGFPVGPLGDLVDGMFQGKGYWLIERLLMDWLIGWLTIDKLIGLLIDI